MKSGRAGNGCGHYRSEHPFSEAALLAYIKEHLGSVKTPKRLEIVDHLPLTPLERSIRKHSNVARQLVLAQLKIDHLLHLTIMERGLLTIFKRGNAGL